MGNGCYAEKSPSKIINRKKQGLRNSLYNEDIKQNKINHKDGKDKLSTLSSNISYNITNNLQKKASKNMPQYQKNYTTNTQYHINIINNNQITDEHIICNIIWINFSNKERKKFQIKLNKLITIPDLINLIQLEMKNLYQTKDRVLLFHKGLKVHEDETIISLLNKQNEIIDINLSDNEDEGNKAKKEKVMKEITFEVILVPLKKEENNNLTHDISKDDDKEVNNKSQMKEYEFTQNIVSCLFPKCDNHKTEQLAYICLTCNNSFCDLDFEEHKSQFPDHEVIKKNKLIDLNFEVKCIKNNLNAKYQEIVDNLYSDELPKENLTSKNQINYISTNDLFTKTKIEINNINEKIESVVNRIRQNYQKVNLQFLSIYEDKMVKIIEFSEYMDKTISTLENLNIFSDENMFIENYENYNNIKNISDKYYKSIIALKDIIIKYKEFLESYKNKGNIFLDHIKQGIDSIFKIRNVDKIFDSSFELNQTLAYDFNMNKQYDLNNMNSKINTKKTINDISMNMNTSRERNQSINLKFLFSDKKIKKYNTMNNGLSNSFQKRNSFLKYKKKTNLKDNDNNISLNIEKIKNNSEQYFKNNPPNDKPRKSGFSIVSSNSGNNN